MSKFETMMNEEKINEGEVINIPENNKSVIDEAIKKHTEEGYNIIDFLAKDKKETPKAALTLYLEEDDIKLLKAIATTSDITVNKVALKILKTPLDYTRNTLPKDFDIDKLAKQYDNKKSKKRKK